MKISRKNVQIGSFWADLNVFSWKFHQICTAAAIWLLAMVLTILLVLSTPSAQVPRDGGKEPTKSSSTIAKSQILQLSNQRNSDPTRNCIWNLCKIYPNSKFKNRSNRFHHSARALFLPLTIMLQPSVRIFSLLVHGPFQIMKWTQLARMKTWKLLWRRVITKISCFQFDFSHLFDDMIIFWVLTFWRKPFCLKFKFLNRPCLSLSGRKSGWRIS